MGLAGAASEAASPGAGLAAVAAYASPWTEAASPGATFLDQLVGSATTYDDVVTESASAGSAWATSGVTAAQVSEAAGAGEQVASSAWLAEQLAEVAAGDDLVIGAQLFAETLDEAAAAAELLLEQLVPAIPENADRTLLLAFSTRARSELGLQVPAPFAIGFTSRDPASLTLAARPAAALSLQPRSAALDLGS